MGAEIINLEGGVSLERIPPGAEVYIARLHDPGNGYGSDWHGSLILLLHGDTCDVTAGIAGDQHFNHANTGAMRNHLKSRGVKTIRYSKIKNGALHTHELAI